MTGSPTLDRRTPLLSAVVCAADRPELLRDTLESLCRQTLAPDSFEVVVVDGSLDGSARALALPFEPRVPLRYAHQPNAARPTARNHGISLARGDVVLFLDRADVADPALLEAHLEMHRRLPRAEVAVLGSMRLASELELDPAMRFGGAGSFLFAAAGRAEGDLLDFTATRERRSSCKRSFLLEHGGFHDTLRAGCEDVELAYRLSKRGLRIVHQPRAVSTTVARLSFDEICERMEIEGRSRLVFSRLDSDDAVQRWTEVGGAAETWRRLGPAYDLLRRSGRELDRIARMRLEAGLGIDATDVALLYQAYATAFHASRVKGIVEGAGAPPVERA